MDEWLFWLGFSFFGAHEIDAVRLTEWRILPLLSRLEGERGYRVFVLLHVPLYLLLLTFLARGPQAAHGLRLAVCAFLIVHLLLHLWLHRRPQLGPHTTLSWLLIGGAAACGALWLLIAR